MFKNIHDWLIRHRILMRTFCYAVILVCIPLMIISMMLTMNARRAIREAAEERAMSLAEMSTAHCSTIFDQIAITAQTFSSSLQLKASNLNKTVYGDREALETLKLYKSALSYISLYGIYDLNRDGYIYTSGGKYDLDIFLNYVIHLDRDTFDTLIDTDQRFSFLPWQPDSTAMLCSAVMYPKSAQSHRASLFVCSSNDLLASFASVLSGTEYRLAAIFDENDEIVFHNTGCPADVQQLRSGLRQGSTMSLNGCLFCRSSTLRGFSAAVYAHEDILLSGVKAFEVSIRLVVLVDIFISLAMIVVITWLNYRPVTQLMSSMNLINSKSAMSEFDTIHSTWLDHSRKMEDLARENDENRALIIGHLLDKLLNGRKIEGAERLMLSPILADDECVFVAVTRLDNSVHTAALERAGLNRDGVLPLEMRQDNCIAFICHITTPSERERLASDLQRSIGLGLGAGTVVIGWEQIHKSYLEAILTFDHSGGQVMYYEQIRNADGFSENDRSVELMHLAHALKNGDETALSRLGSLFDDIATRNQSFFMQRYNSFQLVDSLRNILDRMSIPMSSERAAQIMSQNTLEDIRNECLSELSQSLAQIRESEDLQRDSLRAQILELVNSEYTRTDFSLLDVAEALNMTEYSASRIFKDYLGISFKKYVTTRRIELACELLKTTKMSIIEVAEQVGFASCSYFIRVFKAETGLTPTTYRQVEI